MCAQDWVIMEIYITGGTGAIQFCFLGCGNRSTRKDSWMTWTAMTLSRFASSIGGVLHTMSTFIIMI